VNLDFLSRRLEVQYKTTPIHRANAVITTCHRKFMILDLTRLFI